MIQKKILILGGYGFIGSNLYKILKKKNFVKRLGKTNVQKQKINKKNLTKINYKFDYIFHCAGSSSVKSSYQNLKQNKNKTIGSTEATLEYIAKFQKQTKLVFISSPAVYGQFIKQKKLKPLSPYGKNKLICEKLIKKYSKKYKFKSIILRFFSIYGEGLKKQLIWDACQKILKKNYIFNGSGEEIRTWMHIDDASNIIIKATKNISNNHSVLNICGEDKLKNKEMLNYIFKSYGVHAIPKFNNISKIGDPKYLYIKNDDLKKIGYNQKIPIKFGIKNYIKWYKKK